MKMIELSEDHYIVVDESIQPVNGFYYDAFVKAIKNTSEAEYGKSSHCWQITRSTQPLEFGWGQEGRDFVSKKVYDNVKRLSLSEVKDLIGEVDVEKKAKDYLFYDYQREWNVPTNDEQYGVVTGYIKGYNQALEDNKDRKYTREDLLDAFTWGFLEGTERRDDVTDSVNKFSQSLQPKTEWDVEFDEHGKLKLKQ